jgi:hypothetical protein
MVPVGVMVTVAVEPAPLTVDVTVVVEGLTERQLHADEICLEAVYLDRQGGFFNALLALAVVGCGGPHDDTVVVSVINTWSV